MCTCPGWRATGGALAVDRPAGGTQAGGMKFDDILAARELLRDHLPETPMWSYPLLDELAGTTVHVKHENAQPTGAFKVRGGITLLAGLSGAARARGLVAYSTGNHAQSIAYACALFGARCVVVMPAGANPAKVGAVRALGATVELHGATMTE